MEGDWPSFNERCLLRLCERNDFMKISNELGMLLFELLLAFNTCEFFLEAPL